MRKHEADRAFVEDYYGGDEQFRLAVQDDYCKAEFNWICFVDSLCKAGEITQHQYATWAFPGNKYRR